MPRRPEPAADRRSARSGYWPDRKTLKRSPPSHRWWRGRRAGVASNASNPDRRHVKALLAGAVAKGLLVRLGERGGSRYELSDEIVLRAGSQSIESHRRKRQTVLDAMDRHGSISTVEGAALLGESVAAVRQMLKELMRSGAVGARRPYPRSPLLPAVILGAVEFISSHGRNSDSGSFLAELAESLFDTKDSAILKSRRVRVEHPVSG